MVSRFDQKLSWKIPRPVSHATAAVQPDNCKRNFHKNFESNLETELLTHSDPVNNFVD